MTGILNRKIGRVFRAKCFKRQSEEGGFSCLARREEDDVLAIFDAADEIGNLLGAWNNIVMFRTDAPLGSETSHCRPLKSSQQFILSHRSLKIHC